MFCDLWKHILLTLQETNILLTMEKFPAWDWRPGICDRSQGGVPQVDPLESH